MASSSVDTVPQASPAGNSTAFRKILIGCLAVPLTAMIVLEVFTLRAEQTTERQRRAIAIAGGKSETVRRVPSWLQAVAGENFHTFLDRTVIIRVNMTGEKIGDEQLQKVAGLPNIDVLDLEDSHVTNASLPLISGLKSLTQVRLVNTKVSEIGTLASMPLLNNLAMAYSDVRENNFSPLKEFPKLRVLGAGGLQVTDAGVQILAECPHLEELSIAGAKLTSTGLNPLIQKKNLKYLSVKDAIYDPANLQALKAALPDCKFGE